MTRLRLLVFIAVFTVHLLPGGLAIAKVRVYLDESRQEYIEAEELDCKVYEGRSGLTIGFKAGLYVFGVGPQVTLGRKESIQWDKSVHGLIARYKELCNRFNSGAVTLKEYNERIEKLDALAREMAELQESLLQRVKEESRGAFEELEAETRGAPPGEGPTPGEVSLRLNEISRRLEDLP